MIGKDVGREIANASSPPIVRIVEQLDDSQLKHVGKFGDLFPEQQLIQCPRRDKQQVFASITPLGQAAQDTDHRRDANTASDEDQPPGLVVVRTKRAVRPVDPYLVANRDLADRAGEVAELLDGELDRPRSSRRRGDRERMLFEAERARPHADPGKLPRPEPTQTAVADRSENQR